MRMQLGEIEYMDAAQPADLEGPRFGSPEEARKIRRLIRFLRGAGFWVHSLAVEGEGYVRTPTERRAVCEVFEWDAYLTLRFYRRGAPDRLYGVLLVTGNGDDILSDWTYDDGPFSAAMDAFGKADEKREV